MNGKRKQSRTKKSIKKKPQNQISLENERAGCPVSQRKFGRGFIKGSWEAILPGQIEL